LKVALIALDFRIDHQLNKMDDVDRVAHRMTFLTVVGSLAGAFSALLKGHPVGRTVQLTAISCALVGTACFGCERVVTVVTRTIAPPLNEADANSWERMLGSHVLGGLMAGSFLGAIYIQKPMQGAAFFMPFMLFCATGEKLFEDLRQEKQQQALALILSKSR
jgi:hypothetical protein